MSEKKKSGKVATLVGRYRWKQRTSGCSLPAAPGFLDRIFATAWSLMGCDGLCVDNYFTGTKDNVVHLAENPRFEMLRHDVTFPLYVEVDEIWNLACPASPIHYQHDPVQTTKTCVYGAINILGLAKRVRAKVF